MLCCAEEVARSVPPIRRRTSSLSRSSTVEHCCCASFTVGGVCCLQKNGLLGSQVVRVPSGAAEGLLPCEGRMKCNNVQLLFFFSIW